MINSTAVARKKRGDHSPLIRIGYRLPFRISTLLIQAWKILRGHHIPKCLLAQITIFSHFPIFFLWFSHGFCHGSCHGFVGKAPMMACLAALPAATPSQAATSCSCKAHGQHLDTLRWRWWRWWPTSPRNGDFHKWWVPEYEWFLSWKNLLKWMITRGTPISGNLQICDKSWKNCQKLGIWWHLQQNMRSITR